MFHAITCLFLSITKVASGKNSIISKSFWFTASVSFSALFCLVMSVVKVTYKSSFGANAVIERYLSRGAKYVSYLVPLPVLMTSLAILSSSCEASYP